MNRLVVVSLLPLALAGPAMAQTMDHSSMPGMTMPAAPAKPAAKPAKPEAAAHQHQVAPAAATAKPATPAAGEADPHAGHDMSAGTMDHSAMPGMDMGAPTETSTTMGDLEVPTGPPPAALRARVLQGNRRLVREHRWRNAVLAAAAVVAVGGGAFVAGWMLRPPAAPPVAHLR